MTNEGNSKLLPRSIGPYRFVRVSIQYLKIDPGSIRITMSINGLTRAAEKVKPKIYISSDSRTQSYNHPASNVLKKDEKDSYAVEKVVGYEDITTRTCYFAGIYA